MAIVIYGGDRDIECWVDALKSVDSSLDIRAYPEVGDKNEITFAISWTYPHGLWNDFPNLKAISSIGAGVSHILSDENLPEGLPVLKLTDSGLNQSMFEYILSTVSYQAMRLHRFQEFQKQSTWDEILPRGFSGTTVGIFGLGSIGNYVATRLATLGFEVMGFANSPKEIEGVTVYTSSEVTEAVMQRLDVVVSILPLTSQTENMFDRDFFAQLQRGATFINVGRGPQVVEVDLVEALNSGQLSHAYLDVFREEPLPSVHDFWSHPQISVTPHIASITDPMSVAAQIVENYQRISDGLAPHNVVDRTIGY